MKTWQRLLSEGVGTAVLLCVVIGSGIMAEQLAQGNAAIALLGNTFATVFALYVLIETLGPISGAHFNPAVTLFVAWREKWPLIVSLAYVMSQLAGAACGAWLAHAMFGVDVFQWSDKVRTGFGQWLAEFVATAGLLGVILLSPAQKTASLVAAYIGAAYWFTASTSFANPAAVFGRMMSNSFAGIAPGNALEFIAAELAGLIFVVMVFALIKGRN